DGLGRAVLLVSERVLPDQPETGGEEADLPRDARQPMDVRGEVKLQTIVNEQVPPRSRAKECVEIADATGKRLLDVDLFLRGERRARGRQMLGVDFRDDHVSERWVLQDELARGMQLDTRTKGLRGKPSADLGVVALGDKIDRRRARKGAQIRTGKG